MPPPAASRSLPFPGRGKGTAFPIRGPLEDAPDARSPYAQSGEGCLHKGYVRPEPIWDTSQAIVTFS
ncbi:hypothetical protein GCM10025773_21510 [Microbacterium jejuense]